MQSNTAHIITNIQISSSNNKQQGVLRFSEYRTFKRWNYVVHMVSNWSSPGSDWNSCHGSIYSWVLSWSSYSCSGLKELQTHSKSLGGPQV